MLEKVLGNASSLHGSFTPSRLTVPISLPLQSHGLHAPALFLFLFLSLSLCLSRPPTLCDFILDLSASFSDNDWGSGVVDLQLHFKGCRSAAEQRVTNHTITSGPFILFYQSRILKLLCEFESHCRYLLLLHAYGVVICFPVVFLVHILQFSNPLIITSPHPHLLPSINLSTVYFSIFCHLLNFYSFSHTSVYTFTHSLPCLLTVQFA